jgi:DNA-binding SARP family transcriptional activator
MEDLEIVVVGLLDMGLPLSPILICVLGRFSVLRCGVTVAVHSPHLRALLHHLALEERHCLHRDALLDALWPNHDVTLARQSLNSLVYSLRKALGDALGGAMPVVYADGYYHLNLEAGVAVDATCFDSLADQAEHQRFADDAAGAMQLVSQAIELYHGDLQLVGSELRTIVERERLRNRYLMLLAQLAHDHFGANDYRRCLETIQRILDTDPCREDAHRLLMRCYVRQGQRAAALRQYQACVEILRLAFDALPEPTTTALFEQVRCDPAAV